MEGKLSYKDSKGENQWENCLRRSSDLPLDSETKERMHVCKVNYKYRSIPGNSDQVKVSAQIQILAFSSRGEIVKPTQRIKGKEQESGRVSVANVPELLSWLELRFIPKWLMWLLQGDDLSLLSDRLENM